MTMGPSIECPLYARHFTEYLVSMISLNPITAAWCSRNYASLGMKTLKLREVKSFAQGHTAGTQTQAFCYQSRALMHEAAPASGPD